MGGVLVGRGGMSVSQWGRWERISVQTFSGRFLKILTEGAVTTEAGSLYQYFTTLTENDDPLLWRWLVPCRGALLGRVEREGEKKHVRIKSLMNILKAVVRSVRRLRHCKE